jgi:selenocysteine-specific elongation factor
MDVSVRLLPHDGISLRHNDRVKLFIGTAQKNARIRLLGKNILSEGEEGFLQIETDESMCAKKGDHFIIRKASPSITLGGGVILDVNPRGRYKLNDEKILEGLRLKLIGDPNELILEQLTSASSIAQLSKVLGLEKEQVLDRVNSMLAHKDILRIPIPKGNDDNYMIRTDVWEKILQQVLIVLAEKHSQQPFRSGFRMEEIERDLETGGIPFSNIVIHLAEQGKIAENNHLIRLSGFQIRLSPVQESKKTKAWQLLATDPFSPPISQQIREILGQDLFSALVEGGELIMVSEDVVFRKNEVDQMSQYVETLLKSGQAITVAGFRDRFTTSRKFALAFLEYLDRQKVTRRQDDVRVRYE